MEHVTETPTMQAPAERFTGDVYLNMIEPPSEPSRLVAALVRFTPGARTNWHSHVLGQVLYITDASAWSAPAAAMSYASAPARPSSAPSARNTGTAPPTPTSWRTSPSWSVTATATAPPGWSPSPTSNAEALAGRR
ncbi:hypothetical protein QFZ82_002313 [Streptomyces sp. V4I23]|nr:hypothetical protein [Streptomyces sp. V4I23]